MYHHVWYSLCHVMKLLIKKMYESLFYETLFDTFIGDALRFKYVISTSLRYTRWVFLSEPDFLHTQRVDGRILNIWLQNLYHFDQLIVIVFWSLYKSNTRKYIIWGDLKQMSKNQHVTLGKYIVWSFDNLVCDSITDQRER
jgi:hypothetical protein